MKCFVPSCGKISERSLTTKFVVVPYSKIRLKWFSAVGKNIDYVNMKSTYYCCESCRNSIQLVLKNSDTQLDNGKLIEDSTQTDDVWTVSVGFQTDDSKIILNGSDSDSDLEASTCESTTYCDRLLIPSVSESFISKSFGGRSSDLAITTACKLQKSLRQKYSVMADRGFKGIHTILLQKGFKLFRPPSSSGAKMTKAEVKVTKQIASLRIHVERSINRIRKFSMCKPHVTLNHNLIKYFDNVVLIAAGLSNVQTQLIKTN
ncbi:hypothetical protein Bhyg_03148 [Pseudolycoriella hygida]|uniref:DDE Tnp4 domain-containing protein n=1 Tax=Pseudolycoriella hygida TaxID=35572 RepID=A0A9Q0NCV0_9DIPT|nr:hypothetical protein Bhyg_03148 [Pseudolycoriella hygida]